MLMISVTVDGFLMFLVGISAIICEKKVIDESS